MSALIGMGIWNGMSSVGRSTRFFLGVFLFPSHHHHVRRLHSEGLRKDCCLGVFININENAEMLCRSFVRFIAFGNNDGNPSLVFADRKMYLFVSRKRVSVFIFYLFSGH